jgi:hypothetical protein
VAGRQEYHGSMDRRTTRTSPTSLAPAPGELGYIYEGLVGRSECGVVVFVVVTLAWSRAMWAELLVAGKAMALSNVLERAWEFFGGAPHTWVFDTKPDRASEVLKLAGHWGARARPYVGGNSLNAEHALPCMQDSSLQCGGLGDLRQANQILRVFVEEMLQVLPTPELLQGERPYLLQQMRGGR